MSYKTNKNTYKNLFYENEYYQDTEEDYQIIKLNTYEDKIQYINQLVSIFLKCFPVIRCCKKYSIFGNPKDDIRSVFLNMNSKLIVLLEVNSNTIISFFMTDKINKNTTIISNVCTNPKYNRKGFMRTLMNYYIRKTNDILELDVYEENPAKNLYESLGFKFIKYQEMNDNVNDYWEDGMYSRKCLYRYKVKSI